MPKGDGTGPQGKGPKTGRKKRGCSPVSKGFGSQGQGAPRFGKGDGKGRSAGQGRGRRPTI